MYRFWLKKLMVRKERNRNRHVRKYFPIIVLIAYIVLGAVAWEYYSLRVKGELSVGETRQESVLKLQEKTFISNMNNLLIDILELSNRQSFLDYIESPTPLNRSNVEKTFFNLLRIKRVYNKAQFLDSHGMETIKVAKQGSDLPIVTSIDKLVGHADKSFYNETIRLDANTVFVSNIDLKRDNRGIIKPYIPIVKISMPVTNDNNEKLGIIVLHMDASNFIKEIKSDRSILLKDRTVLGKQFIINHNGYYITHPDSTKQWGFAIDERKDFNFQNEFPSVLDSIYSSSSGFLKYNNDIFSYITINILDVLEKCSKDNGFLIKARSQYGKMERPTYKIVNYISEDEVKQSTHSSSNTFSIVAIILFSLFTVASYIIAYFLSRKLSKDEEIKRSRKELQKANATKGKFIKILAHDLKNPITSIQAFAEIISSEDASFSLEQRVAFSKLIRNSTNTMLQLIDDVLAWSKSQDGDLKTDPISIDLSEVVEYAISISEIQASKKEISINTKLPKLSYIYADPNMIVTIIRNLVSNAIKFTNRGDSITIEVEVIEHKVFLRVIDTGVGMGSEKVQRLFDVGVKDYTKGTENESGTGLGMVLCKEFTEKNGGKINVFSKLTKGTTVSLNFPLGEAPIDDEEE